MANQSNSYGRMAAVYEKVRGGDGRAVALAAALEPHLPAGLVLDAGAGTCVVSDRLRAADRRVIAIDISPEMLAESGEREINVLRGLPDGDRIRHPLIEHPMMVFGRAGAGS